MGVNMEKSEFDKVVNGLVNRVIYESKLEHDRADDRIKHIVNILAKIVEKYIKEEDIPKVCQEINDIKF